MSKVLVVVIGLTILFLAMLSFYIAKKRALTCPNCGHPKTVKTGEQRSIERKRRALIDALLFHEFEYICKKCNHKFWSAIEDIWK